MAGEESQTVAEIKRLRKRVEELEAKAAQAEPLTALIEALKAKIEKLETPGNDDFVDWDAE